MSFTRKPLVGPYAEKLDQIFGVKNSFYEYNPGKFIMPPFFMEITQKILDADVREDDVWMISYPRTGSTWCQEMVWLIGNDLDFDGARKTIQQLRAPMIELHTYFYEFEDFMKSYGNSVDVVNNWPSPRFIKTHLPYGLLPTQMEKVKPKIIYVARNPKDMCVSFYHHCRLFHHMNCSFDEFCELMLNDMTPLGSVWNHYLTYWKKRDEPNFLYLKYEDLKRDTPSAVRQIAKFLNKQLTDDEVASVCDFLSFENMRNNPGVNLSHMLEAFIGEDYFKKTGNAFIRKGEVGDWKNHMTPEWSKKFDEWIEVNTRGTGLHFN